MKSVAHWTPVAAAVAVGAIAGASYLLLAGKQYDGTAKLQVVPLPPGDRTFAGFSLPRGSPRSTAPAETLADLVETPSVVDAAAISLRLDREDVFNAVSVETDGGSNVIDVRARTDDPLLSAQLANAIATAFASQRSGVFQADLNRVTSQLREQLRNVPATRRDELPASELVERLGVLRTFAGERDPTVRVAAEAVARESAVWPRRLPVFAVAAVVSLLLGLLLAAVLAFAARRRAPEPETQLAAELPVSDASLGEREDRLAERIRGVTARELALVRAGAAQKVRKRELDEAEADRRERDEALDQRLRELELARREPEPDPEPEPNPEPRPVETEAPGTWNIIMLERLVEKHANDYPNEVDEWHAYLFALRQYADVDGAVPASFDSLVAQVFGELLTRER